MITMQYAFEEAYPNNLWDDTDPAIQNLWRTAWLAALSASHKVQADQPRAPKTFAPDMVFGYERGWRKGAMAVREAIKRLENQS